MGSGISPPPAAKAVGARLVAGAQINKWEANKIVLLAVTKSMAKQAKQAALNTEEAPLGADERRGRARTSAIVLLSIAALLIVVGAVASLSETTDPAQVASTGLADAAQQPTDLDDKTDGNSVMPDSFRIVDARMEAERAAFHNSQSHHKGRRLLGGTTTRTALISLGSEKNERNASPHCRPQENQDRFKPQLELAPPPYTC